MWLPGPREPSGAARSISTSLAGRSTPCARFRNARRQRQLGREPRFSLPACAPQSLAAPWIGLECLLKGGLISLTIRRGHLAGEIGDCGAEGELGPIGILEPELVVADDPGTVQNAAGDARVRTERPIDVNDRRGTIRLHIVDDQCGTGIGVPGRIRPSA